MQITQINYSEKVTFEGGNCHKGNNKYNSKSCKQTKQSFNKHKNTNFKYDDKKAKLSFGLLGGLLTGFGVPVLGIPLMFLGFSNKARKSLIGKLRK